VCFETLIVVIVVVCNFESLGKGAASVVYEAIHLPSNSVVALKKAVPYGDGRDDERMRREIDTLKRV
jgi:serine/threonine protein kinase